MTGQQRATEVADFLSGLDRTPAGFTLLTDGLHEIRRGPDGAVSFIRLCGRIEVTAITHDEFGQEYGRVVDFDTLDNERRQRVVQARRLVSSPGHVVGDLIDDGLDVELGQQRRVAEYLYSWRPSARVTITRRRGWQAGHRAFVLPDDTTLGDKRVMYIGPVDRRSAPVSGTLDGWRGEIAARASGNPLLMVALSTAFTGPLVAPLGLENPMLHLRGGSSCGKSTLLACAASVWQGADGVRPWRATDSGLEGVAERSNGLLLALDELAEIEGKAADAASYMLGNGQGKARATSTGAITTAAHWRLTILSSGEISLGEKLAEAGRTAKAGQAVRALDIAADARTFGAFDDVRGFEDGRVFSDALRDAAARHHGTAGPEFVRALLRDLSFESDAARQIMAGFIRAAEDRHPGTGTGVPGRARKHLAGIAAGGELATKFGITGWKTGEARDSALDVFGAWLDGRTAQEDPFDADAISRIRSFLAQARDRIRDLDKPDTIPEPVAHAKGDYIFVPRKAWDCIFGDGSGTRAAQALQRRGFLEFGDGRNIKARMPAGVPEESRGYKLRRSILDGVMSELSDMSEDTENNT